MRLAIALAIVTSVAGCCASPYRIWQNGWGFNDPWPERYRPGPPPPVTNPPGPVTPAAIPPPPTVSSASEE
jgi:hypothetical protein